MLIYNLIIHIDNFDSYYCRNHFGDWCSRNCNLWRCDSMCINNHMDYETYHQKKKKEIRVRKDFYSLFYYF